MSPHHHQQQQLSPYHHQQQQMSPSYPVVRPGQVPLQQAGGRMGPNMGTVTQRPGPLQIPQQQQPAQGQYGMGQHQQQLRLDTHAARQAEQKRRGSKGSPTSDAAKKPSHSSKQSSKQSSEKDKSHHSHRHDQDPKSGHKKKHLHQKNDNSKESSKDTMCETKQHTSTTTTKGEGTGKKEKQRHPSGYKLTSAPSKTNHKKGVIYTSSDEDGLKESTIKDPFWENLYTGKLTFEGDDMYSKVKQRLASAERGQAKSKALLESNYNIKEEVDSDVEEFEDLRVDKLLDEVDKIAKAKPGSSDFEFEFEQESPDAGYQSPGTDELEAPAFVSDADLHRAVIGGKTHIVRAAFKMNIALNLEQPDSNGATLLMHACVTRNEEILKLLIMQGASVNACSKNGITPLMYVSEQGFASAAGILLEAGAFINFKQPTTGDTALICSSRKGHAEVVQVLLDYGANWALANVNNTTAEKFARLNDHFAVQDILNTHTKRMTRELEVSVTQYMSGTAELVKPLFPLHCICVREACEHNIYLYHELNQYSCRQGFGNLLFLGHANMGLGDTNCRLTGPCYVREAYVNGQLLPQLNQGSNFIVSLPLRHGHNLIKIKTIRDPYTNVIVLVGGYSMQVVMP